MRYYIEAFGHDNRQLLGNLDGQHALGDCLRPAQTTAWKHLFSPSRPAYSRVKLWKLVNERGSVQQITLNRKESLT